MADQAHRITQPAPALLDIALGHIDLIETLGAALAAHQRPIRFGKRTSREHNLGPDCGVMAQMVDDDDVLDGLESQIHSGLLGPPVEIVFQYDNGICGTLLECFQRCLQIQTAHETQPQAIALGHGKTKLGRTVIPAQCPGHVGRRLDHRLAAHAGIGDHQWMLCFPQGRGHLLSQGPHLFRHVCDLGCTGIQHMGYSEAETREITGCTVEDSGCDIIESGGIGGGDEQRALYVLGGLSYCRVLPAGDLEFIGDSH
jgi:hypothetical protein